MFLKQQMFNELVNKRYDKILNPSKKINFDNLTYHYYKGSTADGNLNNFDNASNFFNKITDGIIMLQDARTNQNRYK